MERIAAIGKRPDAIQISILSGTLILAASFINFLRFNHYPLFASETALVMLELILIAALMGLIHGSQRPLGQGLLEALLVFLIIDQNKGGLAVAAVAALIVGSLTIYRQRSTLPFLGMAAFVVIIVGFLGIGQEQENSGQSTANMRYLARRPTAVAAPPALLHIILDAHIGIEGLPTDNARTPQMKRMLKAFYLSRGFHLFGRAYSQHFRTVNSIPQILNFGKTLPPPPGPFEGRDLRQNAYFDLLQREGYRIIVHESDFIDYCNHPAVVRCTRYAAASLRPIAKSPLSVSDRAKLLSVRFALLSRTIEGAGALYGLARIKLARAGDSTPNFGLDVSGNTSPLNAITGFDDLISDLRRAQPGEAYFAHILLPHAPYAMTSSCRLRPSKDWLPRRSRLPLVETQNAYSDQLMCAVTKVDAAMAAISTSPAGRNFIIIVHGDHGSRITATDPTAEKIGRFDRRDLVAGFSTLFAIRGPGLMAGYEPTPLTAPRILSSLAKSNFRTMPGKHDYSPPTVMLENSDWAPTRRVAFPNSW